MANEFVARNGFIAKANSTISGTLDVSGNITMGTALVATRSWVTGTALVGYATESYVNTALSNLTDSAPDLLNTLNELAAALGDDPNFATTVTNSIATKLPLAGGTMTGPLRIDTTGTALEITGTTTVNSSDVSIYLGNAPSDYGFYITYVGSGSGNTNAFRIQSTNAGTPKTLLVSNQDGIVNFPTGLQLNGATVATETFVTTRGYLTAESDPIFVGSPAYNIEQTNIDKWDLAFGWGDHDGLYAAASHTHSATDITSGTLASARLSGNYAINVTGSAATLTTARTLTIGNTGKTFNGSANVSWTLSEIGALGATAKAADSELFDGIDSVNFVYGNAKGTNDSVTTNNDDLDKTGYYTSSDFATKPSGVANWMYIEHVKLYNSNTGYQKQIGYDTYDDRMWVRTKSSNTWSGWKQIWTSAEFSNNSTNWNTAYDWGNHASAGYLTAVPSSFSTNSITIGNAVTLTESTDRADLLSINSGTSGWGGLQITNTAGEGILSLMIDGSNGGLYDDQNADWLLYYTENGSVELRYNSLTRLVTQSDGVDISGNLDITGTLIAGNTFVNGLITGGFGSQTTDGTLDWNDSSNARSGQGYSLLLGNHSNGPTNTTQYFHPFSFEYSNKNGSGNLTQLAIPYTGYGLHYRSRYSDTWDGWISIWDTSHFSSTNISNWDTAYGWGNHASAGYLTSVPSEYLTQTEGDARYHQSGAPVVLVNKAPDIGGSRDYVTGGSGDSSLVDILSNVALNLDTADQEPVTIYFKSGVNQPSDFAYISFLPNKAGSSEEAVLQIGVENDGAGSSDYIRLQGRVSTVVDYVSSEATVIQDWVYQGTQKAYIDVSGNLQLDGGITANGYNKSNWDTAYGWGNHDGLYAGIDTEQNLVDLTNSLGTAAYQDSTAFAAASHTHTIAQVTGLQTELNNKAPLASPALTGTPTAPTASTATNSTQIATTAYVKNQGYITGVTNISGYSGTLEREDNRTISPSELAAGRLKFGFTSWSNNNTTPYADFLHMRSYTDTSGGNDNLVMFLKSGIGMRIYQQAFGSATAYSTFKDVAFTDSSITGNAGSATVLQTARTLTIGNTGKTFNGGANVSWTLAEIGAQAAGSYAAASHTHAASAITQGTFTAGRYIIPYQNGITGSTAPNYSNGGLELYTDSNHVPTLSFHRGSVSATALYEYDGQLYVKPWTTRAQVGLLLSSGNIGAYADPVGAADAVNQRIDNEVIPAIPTDNSQLANGAGYITDGNTGWNNSYGFITASSTDTLTNKSGNISQWTNNSGYITASSSITGTSAGVVNTVSGTSSAELVRGNMGDNDQARILVGATASNAGYLEIATADDGTEPIYVRQYTGVFSTLTRTATLLDGSGNTSFPGTVTAPTFSGGLSGNASTASKWATARTITLGGDLSGSVSIDGSANVTLSAEVANDSHTHDGRYYTESESDARFVNVTGDTVTGNLVVSGASLGVVSTSQGSEAFYVDGVNGRLFTINDDLSDSLFSVNTISGLPVIEAFADNRVNIGPFSNPVTVDTAGLLYIGGLQAATQSYVDTAITNLIGGAPGALDTLNELAAAIADDASYASTITTALAAKAPLASPALTGAPTAPTAATATNTTQIATTAFVKAQGYLTSLGFNYGTGVTANYVVQRDANGYIYANYVNHATSEDENPAVNSFFVSNGDGWTRKATVAHVKSTLGLGSAAYTASTAYAAAAHAHDASDISSGVLATERIPDLSGTYSVAGHTHAAGDITSGTFAAARIPDLSGTYATASHNHDSRYMRADTDANTAGAIRINGSYSYGTYTALSNYKTGADNLVLKGNSAGVSGIFFESEKDGTNINHPSDFGFIQYSAYGTGTSGESNELIIGVSNDADDHLVFNAPDNNGLKFRVGASTTDNTVYHSGNLTLATLGYTGAANANYITDNNQLTNGAGYITGYTETDTLATVIGRGAYFGTTNQGYVTANAGTYGSDIRKIRRITMTAGSSNWDNDNHCIISTDSAGNLADSLSLNSYNDITFRVDTNSNNNASYVRFGNHGTGSATYWFTSGYDGARYLTTHRGEILPGDDRTYDIGQEDQRWRIVFCETLDSAGLHETNLETEGTEELETGTVLVWKGGKNVPCSVEADHMRMGIAVHGHKAPLVQGAEPVLCIGEVNEGDYLITSTTVGHAKAVNRAYVIENQLFDCVLGKALETASGESHLVKTWITI